MKKNGTTRHKFAQKGRSLEVWCNGKELGIQLRVHPSCENADLLDEWIKCGIVLNEGQALSVAASIMAQVVRMQQRRAGKKKVKGKTDGKKVVGDARGCGVVIARDRGYLVGDS